MINVIKINMTERYTKKSLLDKFYTKYEIAEKFISNVIHLLQREKTLSSIKTIIEPSAGSGNFSKQFNDFLHLCDMKILAYDIDPVSSDIIKKNFLEDTLNDINNSGNSIVIGNPPFGKQCSDAIKFFNKCASYKNISYIAFILPSTFKKSSIQDRLDLNFHIIEQYEVPANSFILYYSEQKQEEYSVPCVFQIWKRKNYLRNKSVRYIPSSHFTFVKLQEESNIYFRRVGVNAGECGLSKSKKCSEQSHYFIKTDLNLTDIVEKLNNIEWTSGNTGPRSISKNDLIKELNNIIDK